MSSVKDMRRKMFVFSGTAIDHVKLTPNQENFTAITVCHRTFTDLKRAHAIFSLATPTIFHGFLTCVNPDQSFSTTVDNKVVNFCGVDYPPNKWHDICTTWDSATGLTHMWLDGQPLTPKSTTNNKLTGKPIVTLGQSFEGMVTDVHMWDYVLSPDEIKNFMKRLSFTPGNVMNWAELDCEIIGKVIDGDVEISPRSNSSDP